MAFLLNLVLGFVGGIFYSVILALVMAVGSAFSPDEFGSFPADVADIGPLLLIFIPFIFAIGGAVVYTMVGVVAVIVYNLAARLAGGLEITLEPVIDSSASPHEASAPVAPPRPGSPPPPPPVQRGPGEN